MIEGPFVVKEHIVEGQHIRQYPGGLALDQHAAVRLHVKQYIPAASITKRPPLAGDPTFVIFHANGFHKELYEPFLADLTARLALRGVHPRAFWIADQAYQGDSAELNRHILGDDPHWHDHARDMLALVQRFREEMRQPLVCLSHSMGADQAVILANFHPRLFSHLILLDPSASMQHPLSLSAMLRYTAGRPDSYASIEAAAVAVERSPLMRQWDPRVRRRYIETAFRRLECGAPGLVTEKTSKHDEIRHLARLNQHGEGADGAAGAPSHELDNYPDVDPTATMRQPFYQPSVRSAFATLPYLRPMTLFVLGKKSAIVTPNEVKARLASTGTGVGGNGGIRTGAVRSVAVPGGHFLPMTNPGGTADAVAVWLEDTLAEWQARAMRWEAQRRTRSFEEIRTIADDKLALYTEWDGTCMLRAAAAAPQMPSRL